MSYRDDPDAIGQVKIIDGKRESLNREFTQPIFIKRPPIRIFMDGGQSVKDLIFEFQTEAGLLSS